MSDKDYWYNVKDNNGKITVEKISKSKKESYSEKPSTDEKKRRNWKPFLIVLFFLVLLLPFATLYFYSKSDDDIVHEKKYRTFMMYMVGSDLESSGSIATFDLKDIKGQNIDLENNNVVLMVGGSKKWHNFVNEDEIGIYELNKSGFKKSKTMKLSNMGSIDTLSSFLDYAYSKYPADKYDMIFWNHGLGAAGLEDDEISEDFLDITELNTVFKKSPFAENKLELIIFNNCLAGSIHFASIMKNYAEYMVASEEVMYVGAIIDRLNFLEEVEKENDGFDIGMLYVEQSDSSIDKANKAGKDLDSTLAVIDLSKIDKVETNMNVFFNSLDLDSDYKSITKARKKVETYGKEDFSYDTVDLYDLASSLSKFSNSLATESLQDSIKEAIKYNSALNDYSNGLSVYFPFYGSTEYIETHIYLFNKLWDNDYTSFITNFYNKSNSAKRANRAGNEKVLLLTNEVKEENNTISIELTEKEKESFQSANIYIFNKKDEKYDLVLKSDQLSLINNSLVFDKYNVLKDSDNNTISSIYERGIYRVFGKIDDTDVILKVLNKDGNGIINGVFVDSNDKPIGGLLDYNDEMISFYDLKYSLLTNEELDEDWKQNKEKENINNNNTNISIEVGDLKDCYILIEMNDENNDSFYSQIIKIK